MSTSGPTSGRQAKAKGEGPVSAGRLTGDGKRVYRMSPPVVIWWCWIALLVLSAGDLVIQGHEFVSVQFAFATLAATGLVFACTLWPRVIAGDDGLTVQNPFRTFEAPWGAVQGIFLADSVEVKCVRAPGRGGEKKDKTIYCWSLSSPRRSRARSQLRTVQWDRGRRSPPAGYSQLSQQAKEVAKLGPAEVIARELAALSDLARARVAADSSAASVVTAAANGHGQAAISALSAAGLSARWAWQPLAAVLLPALAFTLSEILR